MAELCLSLKVPDGDPGRHGPAAPKSVPEVSEPENVAAPHQKAGPTWRLVLDPQWSIRTVTSNPAQVAAQFSHSSFKTLAHCINSFLYGCLTVSGAWSCWSAWSQCSTTCGGGHYQRTRTCSSPAPANGGDICIGLHTEEALCNIHPCEGI